MQSVAPTRPPVLRVQEAERKRSAASCTMKSPKPWSASMFTWRTCPDVPVNPKAFRQRIDARNRVEKSVATVHRFARDLRPTMLDDLGLIPALHGYLKESRNGRKSACNSRLCRRGNN